MRVVGPNSQGLASFHSGAVLGFSTLFTEEPPADGPVGIISQSGALASVPYGILRRRGIGVRYAHGTGNDLDVTAAELAAEAVTDPELGCCCSTWSPSPTPSRSSRWASARASAVSPSSRWSVADRSRARGPPPRTPVRWPPSAACSTPSSSGSGSGRCTACASWSPRPSSTCRTGGRPATGSPSCRTRAPSACSPPMPPRTRHCRSRRSPTTRSCGSRPSCRRSPRPPTRSTSPPRC